MYIRRAKGERVAERCLSPRSKATPVEITFDDARDEARPRSVAGHGQPGSLGLHITPRMPSRPRRTGEPSRFMGAAAGAACAAAIVCKTEQTKAVAQTKWRRHKVLML